MAKILTTDILMLFRLPAIGVLRLVKEKSSTFPPLANQALCVPAGM